MPTIKNKVKGNIYENNKKRYYKTQYGSKDLMAVFKPIYWEVVKVQGEYAMLLSIDILMSQNYSQSTCVTYDSSLVRKYLNKNFKMSKKEFINQFLSENKENSCFLH